MSFFENYCEPKNHKFTQKLTYMHFCPLPDTHVLKRKNDTAFSEWNAVIPIFSATFSPSKSF